MDYGENGYIFAIDMENGLVLAHSNKELIGKSADETGISIETGKGKAKIDGTTGYYVTEEYNGMLIGTFLPDDEYHEARTNQTIAAVFKWKHW